MPIEELPDGIVPPIIAPSLIVRISTDLDQSGLPNFPDIYAGMLSGLGGVRSVSGNTPT
jgi:hypothetical protein